MANDRSRSGLIPTGLPLEVISELCKKKRTDGEDLGFGLPIQLVSTRESFNTDPRDKERQDKERQGKNTVGKRVRTRVKYKWSRVPQLETLTDFRKSWAEEKAKQAGVSIDFQDQWERMMDWEFKVYHSDVDATWRTWVRKCCEREASKKFVKPKEEVYSPLFLTFMRNYPNKTGIYPAWQEWQIAICITGNEQALWNKIKDTLSWQINCEQWENVKYVPSPERYLKDRRWEDKEPLD